MSLFAGKIARREPGAEELDRRNEREPREHAAAEQIAGDARPDDVAHARELRADLGLDLTEELRAAAGDDALEGVLAGPRARGESPMSGTCTARRVRSP